VATDGTVSVIAALSRSIYCQAGPEIVWLGALGSTLHPRAMLARVVPDPRDAPARGGVLRLDGAALTPWTPARPDARTSSVRTLAGGARALLAARRALGPPDGLAGLLGGATPAFPLTGARGAACALAQALTGGDDDGAAHAALALLGLGLGLTPSGDDFVGAAFFARAVIGDIDDTAAAGPAIARRRVLAAAPARTHAISVALLSDMLHGRGHAPLHELAGALAADAPLDEALDAARRLTRIGHCSGWDMLAGFMGGLLGAEAFAP
jgi:uncharacterized protein DUF2877